MISLTKSKEFLFALGLCTGCGSLNIGASSGGNSAKVKVGTSGVETTATAEGADKDASTTVQTTTTSAEPGKSVFETLCNDQKNYVVASGSLTADSYVVLNRTKEPPVTITVDQDVNLVCYLVNGFENYNTVTINKSIKSLALLVNGSNNSLNIQVKAGATVDIKTIILSGSGNTVDITHEAGSTLNCPSDKIITVTAGGHFNCTP